MIRPKTTAVFASTVLTIAAAGILFAGPLSPPAGPVTSTYKTLTEVEPRIAINSTNTPGDGTSVFKITQPGSYYLTGNVVGVAGKNGIGILANSVTVDLMGFEVGGVASSMSGVVTIVGSLSNIAIRNGTVRGWGGSGVDLVNATNCDITNIRSSANSLRGIYVGNSVNMSNCATNANAGGGFQGAFSCTFSGCSAQGNASFGFSASLGDTFTNCSAVQNSATGFDCAAGVSLIGCNASFNSAHGISVGNASTVISCTCLGNNQDGIRCTNGALIQSNNCDQNGNNATGAGIHVTGVTNRIDGNNSTQADFGILVESTKNIIIRNTCAINTTNWSIVANNVCGPILDRTVPASAAISGNSGASSLGTTDPNANFTY